MKLVGERRAIAAAIMVFFALLWFGNGFQGPPELKKALYALAGVYGLAFFSLVAGYFWARWYAMGVGLFGIIVAGALIWQLKALEPIALFFGGTHLAATLALWGDAMSEPFEGQRAWRERYHMDDNAVQRLGRSVIRAGVSLPFVLMYGLMPKPESMVWSIVAMGLAVVGFAGLVKLRTWGVLATGVAGLVLLASGGHAIAAGSGTSIVSGIGMSIVPSAIGIMLLLAVVPFARPMVRVLSSRNG